MRRTLHQGCGQRIALRIGIVRQHISDERRVFVDAVGIVRRSRGKVDRPIVQGDEFLPVRNAHRRRQIGRVIVVCRAIPQCANGVLAEILAEIVTVGIHCPVAGRLGQRDGFEDALDVAPARLRGHRLFQRIRIAGEKPFDCLAIENKHAAIRQRHLDLAVDQLGAGIAEIERELERALGLDLDLEAFAGFGLKDQDRLCGGLLRSRILPRPRDRRRLGLRIQRLALCHVLSAFCSIIKPRGARPARRQDGNFGVSRFQQSGIKVL